MDKTKLLLILNDGNDDLYKVDKTNSSSPSVFENFSKKSSKKISSGVIVAIVLSILLLLTFVISLICMIKKRVYIKAKKNKDENESRVNLNII